MLPIPRDDLKPNTPEFENLPLAAPAGFREYDARWLFPEQINLMGVQALGFGLGTVLHEMGVKPAIAVGHDFRSYSASIKQALIVGRVVTLNMIKTRDGWKNVGMVLLAVLGADLFAHFDLPTAAAFDGTAWDGTAAAGTSAHPRLCPVNNHFGTFACAMGTNLQIVVTNDWHTMLHQTAVASCDATGHVSSTCPYAALAHLYFDTLFYLFNFLLGPVMLALATNALMQVTNASKQAEERKRQHRLDRRKLCGLGHRGLPFSVAGRRRDMRIS